MPKPITRSHRSQQTVKPYLLSLLGIQLLKLYRRFQKLSEHRKKRDSKSVNAVPQATLVEMAQYLAGPLALPEFKAK